MSWAIVAVVGGGLLGAGGSIGGALLSKPSDPKPVLPPSFDPSSDPLVAINTADLLASQGFFTSNVFERAGPISQAIEAFRARPFPGGTRAQVGLQNAIQLLQSGEGAVRDFVSKLDPSSPNYDPYPDYAVATGAATPPDKFTQAIFDQILAGAGYASYEDLLRAEQEYQQEVARNTARFRTAADLAAERQGLVDQMLTRLAREPLDLLSLRDAELARLNRQIDEGESTALRQASVGGFNPGRQLEKFAELRSDADLDALSRAVAALTGQAQSIANLQALSPANRAQGLSPAVQQFRQPALTGAPDFLPGSTSPFGAAVGAAANQLGGTVSTLGLLQLLNQQNQAKPATSSGTS